MHIKSYVINLKRRSDRKERFVKDYEQFFPKIPLEITEAFDGKLDYEVPDYLSKLVSLNNDYDNKPSIRATTFSHLQIWNKIANGDELYGVIFEDDAFFGRTKEQTIKILANSLNYPMNSGILYFGVGDVLPMHTNVPSESMLIAQEKAHVMQDFGGYGIPNFRSAYVFDWLGGFSYILSKPVANKLLEIAESNPIDCAIDSWLKKLTSNEKNEIKAYLTVPLITYTQTADSDTIN